MNTAFNSLTQHWANIAPMMEIPSNDKEYDEKVSLLNQLIDAVGEDEKHPLASLLHFVGSLVEDYEKKHFEEPNTTPQEVLAFLMQEHGLKQKDLPEIGSQGVVSEVLNGKRQLNINQIKALAKRFAVSPNAFIF